MTKNLSITGTRTYLETLTAFRKQNAAKNNRQFSGPYAGPEDFVLQEGREFAVDAKVINSRPMRQMKQCFRNAYLLAVETGLHYAEGYAASFIPTLHAWCVDGKGRVIDPTWRYDLKNETFLPSGYIGVIIPLRIVNEIITRTRHYGVIDAYTAGWPLLQKKFDLEASYLK